ncbi:hypothetical protein LZ31DRAFT_144672 [Colletotrichum somersetense]|nr:hypothetical protein LZ31DRAFT_144672 [Colletotrichum somersetense]
MASCALWSAELVIPTPLLGQFWTFDSSIKVSLKKCWPSSCCPGRPTFAGSNQEPGLQQPTDRRVFGMIPPHQGLDAAGHTVKVGYEAVV